MSCRLGGKERVKFAYIFIIRTVVLCLVNNINVAEQNVADNGRIIKLMLQYPLPDGFPKIIAK